MSVFGYAEDLRELHQKEKEAGIEPDWEMDTFTKAAVQSGKRESIATDLMLKLLGLDVRFFDHRCTESSLVMGTHAA